MMVQKFRIRDVSSGDIVDSDLSYQSALLYCDSSVGKFYSMEPYFKMEAEEDYDISSLQLF